MPRSFTAAQLEVLAQDDLVISNFLQRRLALTYEEFRESLADDLIAIVQQLEENPQVYKDDGEDATTQRIVDMLRMMGYTAHHNAQAGGNVDITVEVTRRNFRWIAEAKIFGDVGDMREGYLQLATRYRAGGGEVSGLYGGLIGYIHRENAAKHMRTWKSHFENLPVAQGVTIAPCTRRGPLGFKSDHLHQDYGLPLNVWHLGVVLHFAPRDLSGRTAKRYQA